MAVYTNINRPGASLQSGNNAQIGSSPSGTSPMALHIEEFGGSVHGTIERKSIMAGRVPMKPVKGTSVLTNFRVGESTLDKVVPGTEPTGTVNQASNVKVTVDTLINARSIVPLLDDFQSSYDARAQIGKEHGKKIAKFIDQAFLIQAIKAARLSNAGLPAGWNGGTQKTLTSAGDVTDPAKLYAIFAQLFASMEDKDVDPVDDELMIVVKPSIFYTLLQADQLIDTTLVTSAGNDIKSKVWSAFGVPIYRSNNLPAGLNVTGHYLSNAGNSNAYDGDFTKTVAAIFSPMALLAGETIPVTPDVFYDQKSKMYFIDAHTSFAVTPDNPAFAGEILIP